MPDLRRCSSLYDVMVKFCFYQNLTIIHNANSVLTQNSNVSLHTHVLFYSQVWKWGGENAHQCFHSKVRLGNGEGENAHLCFYSTVRFGNGELGECTSMFSFYGQVAR